MTWLQPEKWGNMWTGSDCPMCKDGGLEDNPHSFMIKELRASYWRLPKKQQPKGYTMLAAKIHAPEVYLMSASERDNFFADVAAAAKAVNEIFKPVKLHYAIFGSICPHVHLHIIPKYQDDDPHGPVKFGEGDKEISPVEAKPILVELRETICQ